MKMRKTNLKEKKNMRKTTKSKKDNTKTRKWELEIQKKWILKNKMK